MHYRICYSYYEVEIIENIGLYTLLNKDIGKQFTIKTENIACPIKAEWQIVYTEGIICTNNGQKGKFEMFEHNLSGYISCLDHDERFYLSYAGDWAIQIKKNIIYFEALNLSIAYTLIQKILKQISRSENIKNDKILLHSSCLATDGNAFMFLGNKGMGKTTMLLNLLSLNRGLFKYIGNDINVIDFEMNVYPIYSKVGIGKETINFINRTFSRQIPLVNNKKNYYNLGDFVNMFDVQCADKAHLKMIFILDKITAKNPKIIRLDCIKAEEIIKTHILTKGKHIEMSDHPDWLHIVPDEKKFLLAKIAKKISHDIPCISIQNNLDSSNDYQLINEMIHKSMKQEAQ